MPKRSPEEKARIRRETEAKRDAAKSRDDHDGARGRQVGGKALSELSNLGLGLAKLGNVLEKLKVESDRGTAIMGGSLVEAMLDELILGILVNKDDRKSVFDDKGAPLATFSNKTIMAYALGQIDKATRQEIDTIRTIRNAFSHALLPIDFQTPEVSNACTKLMRRLGGQPKPNISARHIFLIAASGITEELSLRIVANTENSKTALDLAYERAMVALAQGGA